MEENFNAVERSGLVSEISDWLNRVYDDVLTAPAIRHFQEHANAIDKLKERISQLPDDPLSKEDIATFKDALEKLKAELLVQIQKETTDKEELKKRVEILTNDISFLKSTLDTMTKKTWSELLVTRFQKWWNRLGLHQIAAGARILRLVLPPSAAEAIETTAQVIDEVADVVDDLENSNIRNIGEK